MTGKSLVACLLLSSVLLSQSPREQTTGGAWNCRFWNSSTHDRKLGFVIGYLDAWGMIGPDTTLKSADYVPMNSAYGEMTKGIDEACAAPENALYPNTLGIGSFRRKN